MNNSSAIVISALLIGLGLTGGGYTIGKGVYYAREMNRTLTVKGLAEQDVTSDLGIWDINYREVGNDLIQLNQKLEHDREVITAFLKQRGFTDPELNPTQLKVEDRLANVFNQTDTTATQNLRYVVTAGIRVRSNNVNLIQQSLQATNGLLQQGVPLAFDVSNLSPNPSFYFTKLDSIRPQMLADATNSARHIAAQFAKDSGTHLKDIVRANQGVFQIMGRDTSTMSSDWNSNQNALGSIEKRARIVTTIDYRIR